MAASHAVRLGTRRLIFPSAFRKELLSFLRPTVLQNTCRRFLARRAVDQSRPLNVDIEGKDQKDGDQIDEEHAKVFRAKAKALMHPDYFNVSELFTMQELFNAGVHYGHHEGCWNPLMKPYLYGSRERMHIIDLNQTVEHLKLALNVVSHIVFRGGKILFVCVHPQFEYLTQKLARETNQFFITQWWRGGTLTNSYYILRTRNLPDAVVFLHLPTLGRNTVAVKEAAMCNIPSIAIVDSNCNPNLITYPIPGNDDSPAAMTLYAKIFKQALMNAILKRSLVVDGLKKPRKKVVITSLEPDPMVRSTSKRGHDVVDRFEQDM